MYRKLIYSIFILSICCNIYCGFNYYQKLQNRRWAEALTDNFNIKDIPLTQGNSFLFKKINKLHPEFETTKKYYFISIWNIMCVPCIKEMPLLDTLADYVNRKDFGYLYVTENGEKMINQFRERKKINSRNFTFLNDADKYISSILTTLKLKNRQYPIQLIINAKGEILFNQIGAFESSKDTVLLKTIENLD